MESLFIKLLNMSISASFVVPVVILIRFIFRSAPKWMHCLMWSMVAFRLLCPFSIESDLSIMPSENVFSKISVNSSALTQSAQEYENEIQSDISHSESNFQYGVKEHSQSAAPYDEKISPKRSLIENTIHYGAYVWIIGAAIIAIYGIASYVTLKRRVAEAVPLRDNIYQCDRISSPFLLGVIHPKIYLPFGINDVNIKYIIAHEQSHINRRDNLTKILAFAIAAVYWFNPIVWIAYIMFCRDIEFACDESVIHGQSKDVLKAYSMALLEFSTERPKKFINIYNASPIAFGEIGVKRRVINVIKNKKTAVWIICAVALVCLSAAIMLLTNPVNVSAKVSEKMDRAVSNAIFEYNNASPSDMIKDDSPYYGDECCGEGHKIFGIKEDDKKLTVYMIYSLFSYRFMNGNLVAASGSSCIPTVLNFDIDDNGNYIYKDHKEAKDGSFYASSVKDMFPHSIAYKALNTSNKEATELLEQCHNYARAYLKKIGRNAKVGDFLDFEFKILTDYGVSVEVSNLLLDLMPDYGIYVGNFEKTENGVRYVYEISWDGDDSGNGLAIFRKYKYGSDILTEISVFEVSGDNFTKSDAVRCGNL